MIYYIIATVILIASFAGIAAIALKKIPTVANFYPENAGVSPNFVQKLKSKIKNNGAVKKIVPNDILLLKLLSRARVFILKIEHKIGCKLNNLRQKSITEKKKCFSDNYWEQIKAKQAAIKRSRPKRKKEARLGSGTAQNLDISIADIKNEDEFRATKIR